MSDPDLNTANAALARHLAAIEGIAPGQARIANLKATEAVAAAQKTAELIAKDQPRLVTVFVDPPTKQIEELVGRALALWAAEKKTDAVVVSTGDLPALYAEAGELKALAVKVLDLVAGHDPAVVKVLDAVRPGTGYADRADDLTLLHSHVLARKDDLAKRGLMTAEQVDRMGELAPKLLSGEEGGPEAKAAALLRNRAFTHFYQAWQEVERHLEFLYYFDADGYAKYPRLYPRRPPKKKPVVGAPVS